MRKSVCAFFLVLFFLADPLLALPEGAEPSPIAEDLVAKEKLRSQVESILADLHDPPVRDENAAPLFHWVAERLIALGPDVAPFMVAELENRSRFTFNVAANVLGFLRAPEAGEALRKAAEAADREGSQFAFDRKTWVGYAMAVAGDAAALDILDSGPLNCVRKDFIDGVSILELASILTAPKSVPKLLDKLDRYAAGDDKLKERLYVVLHALRRVADPSIRERVLPYLDHEQPYVRDAAARALAATGDVSVADRLIAGLEDPAGFSRFGFASSIEQLRPAGKMKSLLARLEVEDNTAVRGALYRTLAAMGGESMIEAFAGFWGRPDELDRVAIVDAVGKIKSRKGLNLLRSALKDSDLRVVLHSIGALASIGGAGPTDTLLALLDDPRGAVEEGAIGQLAREQEVRAAPRVADRLRRQLASPLADPTERDQVRVRGEALASFRYTAALKDVQEARKVQLDPTLLEYLDGLAKRLSALEERKDDAAKWAEAVSSPDVDIRRLAYARLADLGDAASAKVLIDSFGKVDVEEGVEILRALGRLRSAEAVPLLERVLLDPSFDASERSPLRSMAAWAASGLGGAKMADLLRRAAERREGRDVNVLVYLATLTGRAALPSLQALRVPRLRHFDWRRGLELERLDFIVHELQAGGSIESLNRPPDEIALY